MNVADQKTKLKKSKKITFSRIPFIQRLKHPHEIHTISQSVSGTQ